MSIGQRIRTMRVQQGLSIDDLAYKLGKNRTTVYRYETGDIENLPLGILDSLANALNTTPAYLMGWDSTENKSSKICENNISVEIEYTLKWVEELGCNALNTEEYQKVMEYAKFLISQRNK